MKRGNFNASGSNLYGGHFDDQWSGTDHSLLTSPILTNSDGVTDGSTNLQSTLGGFSSNNIVGNGVYLSNIGSYRTIVAVGDDNNVTLDATVAAGSGITFNVGGAWALPTTAIMNYQAPFSDGVTISKNGGAFTLTANVNSSVAGSVSNDQIVRGFDTDRDVIPYGTDRPTIDFAAYEFDGNTSAYYRLQNMIMTGDRGSTMLNVETWSLAENLKLTNINAGGSAGCISASITNAELNEIEASLPNSSGNAILAGSYGLISNTLVHDCPTGIGIRTGIATMLKNTILDNCLFGILIAGDAVKINYTTIYDCGTGIGVLNTITGGLSTITDSIIDNCTDGFEQTGASTEIFRFFRNNWSNNTANIGTNATANGYDTGYGATTNDAALADPANGDYTPDLDTRTLVTGFDVNQGAGTAAGSDFQVSYIGC